MTTTTNNRLAETLAATCVQRADDIRSLEATLRDMKQQQQADLVAVADMVGLSGTVTVNRNRRYRISTRTRTNVSHAKVIASILPSLTDQQRDAMADAKETYSSVSQWFEIRPLKP
jgi:hypothetical protein